MDPVPDPTLLRKSGSAGNRTPDLCICSQKLLLIINYIIILKSLATGFFLLGTSPLELMVIPAARTSKIQTAVIPALCAMFQAQLTFEVNVLNFLLLTASKSFFKNIVTFPVAPIIIIEFLTSQL